MSKITIGYDMKKNRNVIIGQKSLRKIKDRKLYLGRNAVCLGNAVIYEGSRIGNNLFIGHNSIIREENLIGDNFNLGSNSIIDYGCIIGNNVKIHSGIYVAQYTTIEDNVFLAPGVIIANDLHPGCKYSKKCMRGPLIKENSVIGARAVINPFIIIGENSLVGSGSVVIDDVPAYSVVCGNPAKIIGKIFNLKCKRGFTDFPYKRL